MIYLQEDKKLKNLITMKIYEKDWKQITLEQGLNGLVTVVAVAVGKTIGETVVELVKIRVHNSNWYKKMSNEKS